MIREPIQETLLIATSGAGTTAIKIPEQYRNQNMNVPVTAWTEDGTSSFLYSNSSAGTYVTVPAAIHPLKLEGVQPDEDGTLFWARAASGSPVLVVQTEENRSRNR